MFVDTPIEQPVNISEQKNKFNKKNSQQQLKSKTSQLNVLFLAPHPYYQDRGTPIDDDLVLRVLSERSDRVDVVTYPEGRGVSYAGIELHRTFDLPFTRGIRPGFSWQKVINDLLMIFKAFDLIRKKDYDLIHAVEEAVFIALLFKWLFGIPYVYDVDSSIAQQMVEKYPWLAPVDFILNWFEGLGAKNAEVVVPVCPALAEDMAKYRPKKVALLPDISQLDRHNPMLNENLKVNLNINNTILMYVGNLESYQGIDLLLDSLALVLNETETVDLVIVGGDDGSIAKYQKKADDLGLSGKVHFVGQRPKEELKNYLSQADILVSPRIKGKNTPMKIYSYLHSGKPLVATEMLTHTQVMNDEVAMLAKPTPEEFSKGIVSLVHDRTLRDKLGIAGKLLIEQGHTYTAYRERLNGIYDWLKNELFSENEVEQHQG